METAECYRSSVGRATIYYEVVGRGEPLLLIHGLSGSGRWWASNIDALAAHFRVYTIDLIGFGRSRGEQPFVLHEAAALLAAWMGQIRLRRAHVVGHSMGGFVAADLAACHPKLVRRLVLVDAAALPFGLDCLPGPLSLARGIRHLSPALLRLLVSDAAAAGAPTIAAAAKALLTTSIQARLGDIRAPTLAIWGAHDALVPLHQGRRLVGCIPGARLAVFPDTGHNPMIERPAAFNRVLLNFLLRDEVSIAEPLPRRAPAALRSAQA